MLWVQVGVIFSLLVGFGAILIEVFRKFGVSTKSALPLLAPLLAFCVGFCLRLSGKAGLIDLGFFLTEFSVLFVSVLFTAFLFLGQIKYWKR